jgi:hypothetical protein
MSRTPKRPLRHRGFSKPTRVCVIASVTLALSLTYLAVWVVLSPAPENIPGDLILDVAFVALAVWVDRLAIRRAREIPAIDTMQR